MLFLNIGHKNTVNLSKVITILVPTSAPAQRMVKEAKNSGMHIDATGGKGTRGVLVLDNDVIVSSNVHTETLSKRISTLTEKRYGIKDDILD